MSWTIMYAGSTGLEQLDTGGERPPLHFAVAGLLAVVVRTAVIGVPRIIRVIIRRVVRVIARLWRAISTGLDAVHTSAAANQNCEDD